MGYVPPHWGPNISIIYLNIFSWEIYLFSFTHRFIQSFIYINMASKIHFVIWVLSNITCFYSDYSHFGHWEILLLTPMTIWHTPIIMLSCFVLIFSFSISLFSCTKYDPDSFVYFLTGSKISHLIKVHWFLLLEWYLKTRFRISQLTCTY